MPHRINVELTLRSGHKQVFAIDEEVLDDLEYLRAAGVHVPELCRAWLATSPWDPAAHIRVFGNRRDGTDVLIDLHCDEPTLDQLSTPPRKNGTN